MSPGSDSENIVKGTSSPTRSELSKNIDDQLKTPSPKKPLESKKPNDIEPPLVQKSPNN